MVYWLILQIRRTYLDPIVYKRSLAKTNLSHKLLQQQVMINNSRSSEFLIGISNKQNKIVKFIDGYNDIKAQKIFLVSNTNPEYLTLLKTQLQNIKDYIIRLNEFGSELDLSSELEILHSQNNTHFVLKVNSPFCQYPNLYDFYRKQQFNPIAKFKQDTRFYIHFFQEFFQLMVKGGGIKNYFYTNNNIWIIPPKQNSFLQMGKLLLNKTSVAGLKFLNGYPITKEEFIEIYPCLPPNVYKLMESKQPWARERLDLLIKLRSFAYLILTFVIKRVPVLFDQNLESIEQPGSQKLRKLLQSSTKKMELLLELMKDSIKKVQKQTGIKLRVFFHKALVQNQGEYPISWPLVYELLFQRNLINENSFRLTYMNKQHQDNRYYLQNKVFFEKVVYQMWEMQPDKEFYIQRGYVQSLTKGVGMIYFLVKVNSNFHRLLRFLNIIQLIKEDKFSQDANQVAIKLMKFFGPKLSPRDQSNPSQVYKQIEQSREQSKTKEPVKMGNSLTFEEESDMNLFNPFSFKNQQELQIAAKTMPNQNYLSFSSGPTQFLQNIYTYTSPPRSNNDTGTEANSITTMTHKLQALIQMQRNLWLV